MIWTPEAVKDLITHTATVVGVTYVLVTLIIAFIAGILGSRDD